MPKEDAKPTKTTPKRKTTAKQKRFVKEYVKGQLATPPEPEYKAALKTYDIDESNKNAVFVASAMTRENLEKPSIKEAIEKAMAKHDITIDSAIAPIADGLKATRSIGFGEDAIEVKDHTTRLKASGMALKLMGAEQKEQSANTFNFINNQNFNSSEYKK